MIVLPAIDILGGKCVRLYKGEYDSAHKVAESPFETAEAFAEAGADFLHTVDLDGAKDGKPANMELICEMIAKKILSVEVGGGVRNMTTLKEYIDAGAARVVLGSSALKDRAFTEKALSLYGEKIAIGIDAKGGKVSCEGWRDDSDIDYLDFAAEMEKLGAKNIIFTDISRDGMLSGPNFDQLAALSERVKINITASGGIADIDHIIKLRDMKLYGAICGKSLYSGTLSLNKAIEVTKQC